jgi:hypothetical protein
MGRWRISDIDQARRPEPQNPLQRRETEPNGADRGTRRGASNESSSGIPKRPQQSGKTNCRRSEMPRVLPKDRDRTYSLRDSEIQAMSDIGRFRTLDARDLARFAYGGNEPHMNQDLRNLRSLGLVEEKIVYRAHKEPRRILALTEQGHRTLRSTESLPKDQRLYHGFVKRREINHDADLYRVYQKAVEEIHSQNGKPRNVRLDFELKAAVNRGKEAARRLPDEQRAKWLKAVTEQYGLTIKGTTIQVPDIQVEYETAEGDIARANLELVSENYRGEAIRGKAESGFKVYARGGDGNRVRRALQDSGIVQEVLSI